MGYRQKSPLPIINGGTNTETLANTNGTIFFDGTSLATVDPGTATWVLTSNGAGSAPTFQAGAVGGIVTLDGDTGSATGSTVSLVGAGTISTSATGSTVTITGTGGGIVWNNVTGTSQSAAVNNGYIANNGSLVTITLPATGAVGDVVSIQGAGSGLWRLGQNASQTVSFNAVNSTTGVGGQINATSQYDSISVICITTNTGWAVNTSSGNLSVV